MRKTLIIKLILQFCVFNACQNSDYQLHSTDTIKLNLDNNDVVTGISADSIFKEVQYIPLETTQESFIGAVDKIKIQDSLILVYNKTISSIYIFDISGKYIKKLQKRGRGKGEYHLIDDFNISNNRLIILDGQRKQLLYYSLDELKFINKVHLNDGYTHFSFLDNQMLLYANFQTSKEKYYNLVAITAEEQYSARYMLPFPDTRNGTSYRINYVFCDHNNAIYTSQPWDYSIYKVDTIDIQKVLTVDFQDYSVPASIRGASTKKQDEYMSKYDRITMPVKQIDNLIITDTYYLFSFIHRGMIYTCRYNLYDKTHIYGVIGGTKRFPYFAQTYHGSYKNKLIDCIDGPRIVNSSMKRPNILMDIHEMSNPVIALYDIK